MAMAYRSLVVSLHEELADRGWRDVRPQYGYVLLACRDRPTTSGEVATLLGVSQAGCVQARRRDGRGGAAAPQVVGPGCTRQAARAQRPRADGCSRRSRRSTPTSSRAGRRSSAVAASRPFGATSSASSSPAHGGSLPAVRPV